MPCTDFLRCRKVKSIEEIEEIVDSLQKALKPIEVEDEEEFDDYESSVYERINSNVILVSNRSEE